MKPSKQWFVWDGLGITCAMFTYFLIGYAEFVVVGVMLLPELATTTWGLFHSILFTVLAILAVVAHVRAMITNPVRFKDFIMNILFEIDRIVGSLMSTSTF